MKIIAEAATFALFLAAFIALLVVT